MDLTTEPDPAPAAEAPAAPLEEATPLELPLEEADAAPPLPADFDPAQLKAILEAVIYVTDEPLSLEQIAIAVELPRERVEPVLNSLVEEYSRPDRGLTIRELAGGFKMGTKPEHHEAIRKFVKNLKPPLKLSLAALETLAVVAYKQPITAPEILEIRGVQGAGVLKTLLDRKLITIAGRKNVIGRPMLYKTTRDFLVQFGLKDLAELPTLKEFEELRRLALSDESGEVLAEAAPEPAPAPEPEPVAPGATAAPAPEPEPVAPGATAAPEPEPEPVAPGVTAAPEPEPEPVAPGATAAPAPEPEPVAPGATAAPAPEPEAAQSPEPEPLPEPNPDA